MVDTLVSLPDGIGYRQVSLIPLVVIEASGVLADVGEEPVSLRKEYRSNSLHPLEFVDGFVFQRRIYYHLQQCISIGIGGCCFPPVNELIPEVVGICGFLVT